MGIRKKPKQALPTNDTAFMGTQQAAVWLGRSLSTHDVMIRVTSQLMDIVAIQQHTIAVMQEQLGPIQLEGIDIAEQSEKILKELDEIRAKIDPVLKMVDESCAVLEKMVEG
jgi:hypothetical protein